jgi:hypothetical protein
VAARATRRPPASPLARRRPPSTSWTEWGAHAELLEQLGPHTTGVGCIYVNDLTAVDLDVLEAIVSRSYAALTAGTYTKRAREGGTS